MSERTAADVVMEWREWKRKFPKMTDHAADAELASRINYWAETQTKGRQIEAAQQVLDAIKSRWTELQLELDQAKVQP